MKIEEGGWRIGLLIALAGTLVVLAGWAAGLPARVDLPILGLILACAALLAALARRNARQLAHLEAAHLKALAALSQSEVKYRLLAEALPHHVFLTDLEGKFLYLNPSSCQYHGMTIEQLNERGLDAILHADDLAAAYRAQQPEQVAEPFVGEFRVRRHDGVYHWFLVRTVPMRDDSGRVTGSLGTATDIDAGKCAEREVRLLNDDLERRVIERTAELAEANATAQASRERFELAVRGSKDGIWDWDLDTNQVYYSPRWKALLGYEDHEVGNSFEEFEKRVHTDDLPLAVAAIQAYLGGQSPTYGLEIRMRHKDGSWRWIYTRGVAQWGDDGKPHRMAGSHMDLTTRKSMELDLQRARDAAEAANRAKSEFVANMSHEIRTPMNGILGMTELMQATTVTDEQREYLGAIRASGESLLAIINDILDFSKIEAGKIELESDEFRLREMLNQALRPLRMRAEQKGVGLNVHVDPAVPDQVIGDDVRLGQVLTNLVGNAIKFTLAGTVEVRVRPVANEVRSASESAVTLQFRVRDTGIGIPADKLDKVFRPFEQADGSMTRRFGGTGLGLSISARLVDLMGGTIRVESEEGKGSTFWFDVRLARPYVAEVPRVDESASIALPSLRILLAEDNPINQLFGVRLLEKAGHCVRLANNGREALAALALEQFDVVLMDVQMPEMDGLEAVSKLREQELDTGRRMPVIALTAHAMKGDRERFLAAGMDGYVTKPMKADELLRAIAACVRR